MLEDKYVDRCLVCVKWDELVLINAWQIHRIGIGHHEYDCDRYVHLILRASRAKD